MNKQELENEVSKLRQLLVQSRNETTVAYESVQRACTKQSIAEETLKNVRWTVESLQRDNKYYIDQLQRNGDAWSKKYLELEEKSVKALQLLTKAGLDALALQRDSYEKRIKAAVNEGKLCIEQAKTDTMAYAFEHVTKKLAEG